MSRPKTFFLDIDGTLLKHFGQGPTGQIRRPPMLLEGVIEKLSKWEAEGHMIILVTARRPSYEADTVEQLRRLKVPYDKLIMGCTTGKRIMINDAKPENHDTCEGVVIPRNQGLKGIERHGRL